MTDTTATKHNRGKFKYLQRSKTKKDLGYTAGETFKDTLVGVGGGVVGAAIGRPSLVTGILLTGASYFFNAPSLAPFGVGMMVSGGLQPSTDDNNSIAPGDTESKSFDMKKELEAAKQRVTTFKDTFMKKLYVDKIKGNKDGTDGSEATQGLDGDVRYFLPGNDGAEVDTSVLDKINQKVIEATQEFAQQNNLMGAELNNTGEMGEAAVVDDLDELEEADF